MKNIIFTLLLTLACVSRACPMCMQQQERLAETLRSLLANKQAEVGVAVIVNGTDTIVVNNDGRYPLMSVFKFHQALATAHYLERNGLPLDTPIHIRKTDLKADTYSPLRDKYPEGGMSLSVGELLKYTLQLSDNNACDILFEHTASVSETDRFIRSLGLENFCIAANENDMHRAPEACLLNWSTPLEAALLLEIFLTQEILADDYHDFIRRTMIECRTGTDRLVKSLLGKDVTVGHKTGTGDCNSHGQLTGINDIGFVLMPNGNRYTIAVLVKVSEESMTDTADIIAEVSEVVYRYVLENY